MRLSLNLQSFLKLFISNGIIPKQKDGPALHTRSFRIHLMTDNLWNVNS